MAERRGMILRELVLYLFLGTLLFTVSLRLFQLSWLSFQSAMRLNDVTNDFVSVSERIKYDLLGEIESITIAEKDLTFRFLQFDTPNLNYVVRDYTVMMQGSRLIYNIFNGTSYTANFLSSMVHDIRMEVHGELLAIDFDYGDHSFRRWYRIDHIKTKRVLHSLHHPSSDLSGRTIRGSSPGHRPEPLSQFHFVL